MAAKSKQPFNYVAHIQRGGSVTELAGTREDYSVKHIYQWLWEKAKDMGGWLLAEQITESDVPVEEQPESSLYVQAEEAPPPTFGANEVWGVYHGERYTGALRLSFKEERK